MNSSHWKQFFAKRREKGESINENHASVTTAMEEFIDTAMPFLVQHLYRLYRSEN
jgi:hypothetical protein